MTTLSPSTPTAATTAAPLVGLVAVGTVFVLNGAALGSQLMLSDVRYSESAAGTLHLVHYTLWTLCLVALSQLYPQLRRLRGRAGASIPAGLLAAAGAAAALEACARFVSAFVTPFLAAEQPALVDDPPSAILLVPLLATGVATMLATAAVAVVGLRRRVFPRAAAVLLLVGAVAIPVLGPLSNVLLGAALVWIGSAARQRDRT